YAGPPGYLRRDDRQPPDERTADLLIPDEERRSGDVSASSPGPAHGFIKCGAPAAQSSVLTSDKVSYVCHASPRAARQPPVTSHIVRLQRAARKNPAPRPILVTQRWREEVAAGEDPRVEGEQSIAARG